MKIGFISMPLAGHLNPMTTLARKLKARGHEVVFIGVPDAEQIVRVAGLDFVPFCEEEFPAGAVGKGYAGLANLQGINVAEYSIRNMHPARCEAALKHLPLKIAETGVQALVIDTIHFYIELVPLRLDIPYVHIWNAHHVDLSGASPACYFTWPYETTAQALARNAEGVRRIRQILAPVTNVAKSYAEEYGLSIDWNDPYATLSKLAVITQSPGEFDFPISNLPPQFHYAGPFHDDEGRAPIPFPWEKLTGAPLIYASMGTLVNGSERVYRSILEAMREFPDFQLVLSVGKNVPPSDLEPIPSNTILVSRAPQLELLKRAALCITHGGMNTVLEALARGVPMVAIPVGFDQPGIAARITYHGIGEFIEVMDLTAHTLASLIKRMTDEPQYKNNAGYFRKVITQKRGVDLAADIIDSAFT